MHPDSILWRRLHTPGHDACRLVERGDTSRIEGTCVFRHETGAAALAYEVEYDREWRTRQGAVDGWVGSRRVEMRVTRSSAGVWSLNGAIVEGFEQCMDLDLGFTPATNLSQLRRIALPVGQAAEVPVAWLDESFASLEVLEQRYERRTPVTYWYEAPRFDYAELLQVCANGFVRHYPSLWEAEFETARDAR